MPIRERRKTVTPLGTVQFCVKEFPRKSTPPKLKQRRAEDGILAFEFEETKSVKATLLILVRSMNGLHKLDGCILKY